MKKVKTLSSKIIGLQTGINMIAIISLFMIGACNTDPPPPPVRTITISPNSGVKGDVIMIKGTDFGDDTSIISVTFNDKAAEVQSVTDTLLKAIVPIDAGTGLVKVTIDDFEITGPEFTYLVPVITGVSIDAGTFGDLMVIEGTNFGDKAKVVSVTINGKEATMRKVTDSELSVIVPDGSGTGLVRVTVDGIEVEGPSFTYVAPHPADIYTDALNIGAGSKPAIVIDYDNKIIHLAYIYEKKLWYRQGDLGGNFGPREEVLSSVFEYSMMQPTIVLDENNLPHIAVTDAGDVFKGTHIYYTNRISGSWLEKLVVFDVAARNFRNALNSFITVEDNSVFMATFLIDNPKNPANSYVRIDNVDTTPIVAKEEFTNNFAVSYPFLKDNGELWVFEGPAWAKSWVLQQIDKTTMQPIGDEVSFLINAQGEQIRWLYDDNEEIHAAGATEIGNNPEKEGWYQTLSRKNAGLNPIKFKTSNLHANGGSQPIRDLVAADRVYVVYWNGVNDKDGFGQKGENPFGCTVENQLQFMRVENGEKAKERRRISSRAGIHGTSYRAGPAAAAHPDGGMIVVFPECVEGNTVGNIYTGPMQLYMTHIGKVE